VNLGSTGLKVSKIGFGTYDLGVPSLNITPGQGGRILADAYKLGVNFWDTSDDYGTHPHVAAALKRAPRKKVVISTKTWAQSANEAEKSLMKSLRELETDYLDIFLLHMVKAGWMTRARQVLKELSHLKTTGVVRAVGLSTHSVKVVREIASSEEVDVIMAICCNAKQATINRYKEHIPLEDGSIEEMLKAIQVVHQNEKGVIAMKVLGTGAPPLLKDYPSSITSIAKLDFVDTICIGMRSLDEVKKNLGVILSS